MTLLPHQGTHSPIDARGNGCEPLESLPIAAAEPVSGVLPTEAPASAELDAPALEAIVADALARGDGTRLRAATRALRAAEALARRHEAIGPRMHRLDLERVQQLLAAVRQALREADT